MKPSFWLRRNCVFETPMTVVAFLEFADRGTHLHDVAEDAAVDGLLLQRPVEALGDAVGLRLGTQGEARGDAPELDLVEEVVGGVLRAVVHAQGEAAPGAGAGGAELGQQALADRLKRGKAVADLDRMDADAAGIEMVDRREHPDPALIDGLDADAVGAPHLVRAIRGDRPVVQHRRSLRPAMRREQLVLAHQAQYAAAADADIAQQAQPCPHLAVALADEG